MGAKTDTRERMVVSAALMLRERGVAGTTVSGVLEASGAPRGSVGFHFPGGGHWAMSHGAVVVTQLLTFLVKVKQAVEDPRRLLLGL